MKYLFPFIFMMVGCVGSVPKDNFSMMAYEMSPGRWNITVEGASHDRLDEYWKVVAKEKCAKHKAEWMLTIPFMYEQYTIYRISGIMRCEAKQ